VLTRYDLFPNKAVIIRAGSDWSIGQRGAPYRVDKLTALKTRVLLTANTALRT
jgi:hypothetical protein